MLTRGEVSTLLGWLGRLPAGRVQSRPRLDLYWVTALVLLGQDPEAIETGLNRLSLGPDLAKEWRLQPSPQKQTPAPTICRHGILHQKALVPETGLEPVRGCPQRFLRRTEGMDGEGLEVTEGIVMLSVDKTL